MCARYENRFIKRVVFSGIPVKRARRVFSVERAGHGLWPDGPLQPTFSKRFQCDEQDDDNGQLSKRAKSWLKDNELKATEWKHSTRTVYEGDGVRRFVKILDVSAVPRPSHTFLR